MRLDIELGTFEHNGLTYSLGAARSAVLGWEVIANWVEHGAPRFRVLFVQTVTPMNVPLTEAKGRLLTLMAGLVNADFTPNWQLISASGNTQAYRETNTNGICRINASGHIVFTA